MCGRFVLVTDLTKIAEDFAVEKIATAFQPNRNISPGQYIPALLRRNGQNVLESLQWGLIPFWAKDSSRGNKMFNARAETITKKPSFQNAFQKRRCLIPADGFYEWQKSGKVKKPFLFSLKSGEPFGFAGLYETWIAPDHRQINTCTIITTGPNELIKPIHDRMPVILAKDKEALWIAPENQEQKELLAVLQPYPAEAMTMAEIRIDPRDY